MYNKKYVENVLVLCYQKFRYSLSTFWWHWLEHIAMILNKTKDILLDVLCE